MASSLGLATVLIAALLLALVAKVKGAPQGDAAVVVCFAALCVNLVACLARRWRTLARRPALILFHVSLAALGALAIWGDVVSYHATVPIAVGQSVRLGKLRAERGRYCPAHLDSRAVLVDGLETRYLASDHIASSVITLRLFDEETEVRQGSLEPNEALGHRGLRVSLSTHRGIAAFFKMSGPASGPAERGLIYLPTYAQNPNRQIEELRLPGVDTPLTCQLLDVDILREDRSWELTIPASARVSVQGIGPPAPPLAPGDSMRVGGRTLTLETLRPYAGVVVRYDPASPWICLLFVLSPALLAAHYASRFRAQFVGRGP